MNRMKMLIGATGAILMLYVFLTAAAVPAGESALAANVTAAHSAQKALYTAREEDGRIAIYQGERLVKRTRTQVSHLPKTDRLKLQNGIDLYSNKELKQFIEDYCS